MNGNLFETKCQTIVNTVNCVGTMGAGIAKEAKKRFPTMYQEYARLCKEKRVKPGQPYFWENPDQNGKTILNFPTKNHWRNPSKIEWIIQGLHSFVERYMEWGITSVAFPALGCGHGGLWWIDVKPIMEKYCKQVKIPVEVYRPRLSKTEKALMHAKSQLMQNYPGIKDIQIIRSVMAPDKMWNDWKQSDNLTVRLIDASASSEELQSLERQVFEKYGVHLTFDQS